jgi:hypothetical protein
MLDALHDTEHEPAVKFLDDPARENELWQVREAGLGATAHVPGQPDTLEGWEDSAVALERLGDYLRDLDKLYDEFGYSDEAMPALCGHFGQGCVHTRIPAAVVLADGFSCRTQIHELDSGGREAMHLAELLAAAPGGLPGEHAERQVAVRPTAPSRAGKLAATAGVLAGAAAAAAVAVWGARR